MPYTCQCQLMENACYSNAYMHMHRKIQDRFSHVIRSEQLVLIGFGGVQCTWVECHIDSLSRENRIIMRIAGLCGITKGACTKLQFYMWLELTGSWCVCFTCWKDWWNVLRKSVRSFVFSFNSSLFVYSIPPSFYPSFFFVIGVTLLSDFKLSRRIKTDQNSGNLANLELLICL